ncbi:glycosyltransferase [Lithospermum erythrorhizon]|uniref:Glycosyltransferase n=1 Tax=Lithospermum erythrorhizon TaxID=34254 RepID=A0AAV3R7M4_LITER
MVASQRDPRIHFPRQASYGVVLYRVSDDLTKLVAEVKPKEPINMRMVHGILETLREAEDELRWLVFGDDDTIFFVDNILTLLSEYDHTDYYYIGAPSEFVLSNYWYSFNQGFGGGGFILSYPLAKALVDDMDNCLRRYAKLKSSDAIVMSCIADIGVDLTPHQGIHQIDFRGDISGFLSAHSKAPLISLHHFDVVDSIFPTKDRYQSAHHLMEAANFDQSRILQQTICHNRKKNWSFSIAWGYTVHIYEKIMARSFIEVPIETFKTWLPHKSLPHYMFNTRKTSILPCEAPHVFFLDSIERISETNQILTVYSRAALRALPPCWVNHDGNSSADYVSRIEVISSVTKRIQEGRCECCDILDVENTAKVTFRECMIDEIIA